MMRSMLLLSLLLFTAVTAQAAPLILGGARPAKLYAPSQSTSGEAVPLIVFLHGYGVTGAQVNFQFNSASSANALGYAALIPDGQPDRNGRNFWNATPECCNFYGSERDDVAYLVSLIEEAKRTLRISNVTLFGHSNGGFMAHRMACERPDLLKGIVSVAGGFFKDPSLCKNPGPLTVLQIHGTADRTIPYAMNSGYPGAVESVQNWAELLDCKTTRSVAQAEDLITFSLGGVPGGKETDALEFADCSGGAKVSLWTVNGGQHVNVFNNLVKKAMTFQN